MDQQPVEDEAIDKILTVPNALTLVRFLLIPLYLWLLFFTPYYAAALTVFAIAACTDWMDGLAARALHQVSKFGRLFDPLVDRFLLASGVISVCIMGRLPLWVVILLIGRDLFLLVEGRVQMHLMGSITKVSYVGKFATTFLLFGFGFLLLGMPSCGGLGLAEISWLPGFGAEPELFGIYLVYIGVILSMTVFVIYQVRGLSSYYRYRQEHRSA